MTLPHILLLGTATSMVVLVRIIQFANKTVKIREMWETALEANKLGRNI
ncbi:MAG: hypothetical protein ABFS12_09000 [Bacteroidota bacterium]